MEKLQGPIIHPCLFEEHLGTVGCLEEENGIMMGINYGQFINRFEVDPHCSLPSLEDKMPFLQMLQGVESQPPPPLPPPPPPAAAAYPLMQEPNFQLLMRLQQEKLISMRSCFAGDQLVESCITNNNNNNNNDIITMDNRQLHSSSGHERENHHQKKKGASRSAKKTAHLDKSSAHCDGLLAGAGGRERKKRKRAARPSKNKEQVENQRMTHIAVERNRRRQMNDHLNALRSLMPPSYVQRGDQASIIGGAIDFVKELEQLLQSLQAQKRMRQSDQDHHHQNGDVSATSTSTSSSSNLLSNMLMASSSSPPPSSTLQFRNAHNNTHEEGNNGNNNNQEDNQLCAENRSSVADIEVVVIQNHVNLKIQCQRRPGQLIKAIVALEDLRLSVLHLNITSFHTLVLYSFNLKIEDDCKCRSADEVASAVHQIFSFINIT